MKIYLYLVECSNNTNYSNPENDSVLIIPIKGTNSFDAIKQVRSENNNYSNFRVIETREEN